MAMQELDFLAMGLRHLHPTGREQFREYMKRHRDISWDYIKRAHIYVVDGPVGRLEDFVVWHTSWARSAEGEPMRDEEVEFTLKYIGIEYAGRGYAEWKAEWDRSRK